MNRYDVAVIGAGPGGSIAASLLASSGARVALIDKSTFPRDKACGDLVGPRALALLADLGIDLPRNRRVVSDMLLVGPSGRPLRLPAESGITYPGSGWLIKRRIFDETLYENAISGGSLPISARVNKITRADGGRYQIYIGNSAISADFVIGADGANSLVAKEMNLSDEASALYGFAIRGYLEASVDTPVISLFDEKSIGGESNVLFPGYGWIFSDCEGMANFGVGMGVLGDKKNASMATRALLPYLELLKRQGWIKSSKFDPATKLGGWLKMGYHGIIPARENVLLIGDAAGLVNPLQGEGIYAAMDSGMRAASAISSNPGNAAQIYRQELEKNHAVYLKSAAAIQRLALAHPKLAKNGANLLTSKWMPSTVGSAWGIYWNDLIEGAGHIKGIKLAKSVAFGVELLAGMTQ